MDASECHAGVNTVKVSIVDELRKGQPVRLSGAANLVAEVMFHPTKDVTPVLSLHSEHNAQ